MNGAPGGVTGLGLVVKAGGISATYTAPTAKPSRNRVTVSAELVGTAKKTTVASNITIVDDQWVGTTTATFAGVFSAVTAVTWTLDKTLGSVAYYRASGVTTLVGGLLFGCPTTPPSAPVSPGHGLFTIDSSTNPPIYDGLASTQWSATLTCPDDPTKVIDLPAVGLIYFDATGAVSADGTTIEGSGVSRDQSGVNITWKFTR